MILFLHVCRARSRAQPDKPPGTIYCTLGLYSASLGRPTRLALASQACNRWHQRACLASPIDEKISPIAFGGRLILPVLKKIIIVRGFNLIIRENSYFLSKFWTSSLTGQIKTEFKVKNCWSGPFTKSLSVYVYVCLFALLACLFVCLSSEGGKWQMQTLGERATWALYFLERWKEGRWKLGYICFDKKTFPQNTYHRSVACTILDRKFWFGSNRNSVWLVKQSKLLTSQWLVRFVFAFVWLYLLYEAWFKTNL